MISNEILEELKCSLSDDQHFIVDPIALSNCGHSVCKNCLPNDKNSLITCKICGIVIDQDFSKAQISKAIKQTLKLCMGSIFELVERKILAKLNEFKNDLKNEQELLDTKVKYIEEEIDIRVESMKIEIDEAGKRLKDKLIEMKKEVHSLDGVDAERKIEFFDLQLKELQISIEKKINLNEEYLDKIQNNFKNLNQTVYEFSKSNRVPQVKISNEKANEDLIGVIYFGIRNKSTDIEELLKNGEKKIFDLNIKPRNLVLIDDQIIISSFDDRCLMAYDKDLNFIKRIDRINGEIFAPLALECNFKEKKAYICDCLNHRVWMTDLDFNFIKSVGTFGTDDYQFSYPNDLCYKNCNLYVCDHRNKRIQVYSNDLEFLQLIKLDYRPWKIKSTNSIICIVSSEPQGIQFYNFNDFSLIRSFDHMKGRISQVNSSFYELNHKTKTINCYDDQANFKEEIRLHEVDYVLTDEWDGTFIEFNGAILMTSTKEKKIIKYSKT